MSCAIFGEHLKKYLDELKIRKGYRTMGEAIEDLCDGLQNRIPGSEPVSRRSVYGWIKGEKYPSVEKLAALSDIMEISLDTLLKDRTKSIKELNALPQWYEELSESSKDLLERIIYGYRTGVTHAGNFFDFCYILNELKDMRKHPTVAKATEELKRLSSVYLFDVYFACEATEESLTIHTDRCFTKEEVRQKEIAMSEKKLKPMLAEGYLQKHKNEVGTDNFTEGILRAIDIGYSESDAPPNWYDDAVCADDGGKILLTSTEINRTAAWNEVSYTFESDTQWMNSYKGE